MHAQDAAPEAVPADLVLPRLPVIDRRRVAREDIVSESFESWAVGPASPQFCLHNCISCFIGVLHYQLVHGSIDSLFVPPTKLQDFE